MGGVGRGISVGFIVTLLSLGFTDLQVANIGVTASVVVLTSILFSIGGFINAIYATKFDDISIVPTFVLTPLTYLGGVFYSISLLLLPAFWQFVSGLNPIFYMVNAFRYGILGVSDVEILHSYLMICGFIVVGFTFALYLLNKGKGIRA